MGRFGELLLGTASRALQRVLRTSAPAEPDRTGGARRSRPPATGRDRRAHSGGPDEDSPGRRGPAATDDAPAGMLATAEFSYAPDPDGDPDPGEVVWTWVPYEEHDGRGKDRPVLLVARTSGDGLLGVQLTSKAHDETDYLPVGSGGWDPEGRDSWAKLDRVLVVRPDGMRREGTALPRAAFDRVTERLSARWRR